ncbi:hypothetical protein GQ53DRAFT_82358 [Thozetella sp. PMI_491]|nr:hypothetical protein GQ53DRAFT_82358 [Thozetella sp. PMI_491]
MSSLSKSMYEYTEHHQCQTCFVQFPTNEKLLSHLDEYKLLERRLVAALEECRMHLDLSYNLTLVECITPEGDNDINELNCPSCDREPLRSEAALLRHYETHVPCYEACPCCRDVYTQVSKFRRHYDDRVSRSPQALFIQHWHRRRPRESKRA